jgi:hypothetical protein
LVPSAPWCRPYGGGGVSADLRVSRSIGIERSRRESGHEVPVEIRVTEERIGE